MDIQTILVIVLFAAALFYVGRIIYRSVVSAKSPGCGSCSKCAADFSKVNPEKK